jgi:uncharacterized membrane protein YgcG
MYSKIFDEGRRLSESEQNAVLETIAMFESETGYEFYVLIVDSVDNKNYQSHARLMRQTWAHNIDKSLMLVIAINDRHAELAATYELSNLFTLEFTNSLLVTHFVPDMHQGCLSAAILKFVAACQKAIQKAIQKAKDLQWWVDRNTTKVGKFRKHNVPFLNALKELIVPGVLFIIMILYLVQGYFRCPECHSWFTMSKKSASSCEYSGYEQKERVKRCLKCNYSKNVTKSNLFNNWGESKDRFNNNDRNNESSSQSTYQSRRYDRDDYEPRRNDRDDYGSSGGSSDRSSSGSNRNDGGGGADW